MSYISLYAHAPVLYLESYDICVGDKRPGSHDDTVREYNTGTGAIAVPISKRTYADALKGVLPNSAGRRNKIQSRAHSLERIPSN